MNKKFLSLVLALVMVLGTFGNVFAAAAPKEDEVPKLTSIDSKVQWLVDNKIVIGAADKDGNATGDLELDKPIRRDAVTKMLVYAIKEQDYAAKLQGVYRPFPDVALDNVMNGYIAVGASKTSPANNLPFIVGYEDGLFRPTKDVTYAELAKMLVVTIDKDLTKAKADNYSWTQDWVNRAVQLGIFEGLSIDDVNAKAIRKDAFAMIYNAFYELKDIKPVPANEMRGVISEKSDGTDLVLNQGDYKAEYKIDKNTVFVKQDGENQKWLSIKNFEDYWVGSVVRVLSEDGVATHVIEMGNPEDGIQNRDKAWVDLGNKTLDLASAGFGNEDDGNADPYTNVKVDDDKVSFVDAAGEEQEVYETSNQTEFYVADYDADILTKVKDFDAAKDLVADDDNLTTKVYLAYEKLPKSDVKEAKVVVFNKALNTDDDRLVRVTKAVSRPDYILSVQGPGYEPTKVESYDLRDNDTDWPYNYNLDNDDVFKLSYRGDKYRAVKDKDKEMKIDASEAPVFKIADFLLKEGADEKSVAREDANMIVLEDKDGFQTKFALPKEYDAFFGKQAIKDAHVQIMLRDGTHGEEGVTSDNNVIDIISVVNRDLKGFLKEGEEQGIVKGIVASYTPRAYGELARVEITPEGHKKPVSFVTALGVEAFGGSAGDDTTAATPADGSYVEVRVGKVNKTYDVREVLNVKELKTSDEIQEIVDEIEADLEALKNDDGVIEGTKENWQALQDIKDDYKKSYDANGELKEKINEAIKEYNKNNGNLDDISLL